MPNLNASPNSRFISARYRCRARPSRKCCAGRRTRCRALTRPRQGRRSGPSP
jgi:hypothetical protein